MAGRSTRLRSLVKCANFGTERRFWPEVFPNGRDILAAKVMGADLAYMGTRFIPTVESLASEDYKNMLIESDLDDIIYTDAFSGVNANYLKPSIERAGFDPEHLEKKGTVDFSKMNETGPKAWKDIWSAGDGVGQISGKSKPFRKWWRS